LGNFCKKEIIIFFLLVEKYGENSRNFFFQNHWVKNEKKIRRIPNPGVDLISIITGLDFFFKLREMSIQEKLKGVCQYFYISQLNLSNNSEEKSFLIFRTQGIQLNS